MSDPTLSDFTAIVIDEAHQHTVATDLLLGLLKDLTKKRGDLRVIIMSATINAAMFASYFPGAVTKTVSGREYNVDVRYLEKTPTNMTDAIVNTVLRIHITEAPGNILVFVSGVREINEVISELERAFEELGNTEAGPLECYGLHAKLASYDQDHAADAVAPNNYLGFAGRKVIVGTNIAETSVTLTDITHVVDSGLVKEKFYNPEIEMWSLQETFISKATAMQRSGRAGRTSPGKSWRLYTQAAFEEAFPDYSVPSILETDMQRECLQTLMMKRDPITFPFMVPPASETVVKAMGMLRQFYAVNQEGNITDLGRVIAKLPIKVELAVSLFLSQFLYCSDEMISLISMIEATDGGAHLFLRPKGQHARAEVDDAKLRFRHVTGDHLTLFNVYMAWRQATLDGDEESFLRENWLHGNVLRAADQLRSRLLDIVDTSHELNPRNAHKKDIKLRCWPSNDGAYYIQILKALAMGGFMQVARRISDKKDCVEYVTLRHGIHADLLMECDLGRPSKTNRFVLYNELLDNGEKITLRLVSVLVFEHIASARPEYWSDVDFMPADALRNEIVGILSRMTGLPEVSIRGDMPPPVSD
jgi:pre-mRNA-splicing factor ATP-dependent RNA helicase DHX15/PRP43